MLKDEHVDIWFVCFGWKVFMRFFWNFMSVLDEEHEARRVWSCFCISCVWILFTATFWPIETRHWINANDVVLCLWLKITLMPLSQYYLFYFISFSFSISISLHELQKFIGDSFLVQNLWDFLHCSPYDV